MGVVEGLTEYLPVSSTAHLKLTQSILGISDSPGVSAFEIVIQAGAILAVVGVYSGHVRQLLLGMCGRSAFGRKLLILLFAAFVPAAILGLMFEKYIDKANLGVIASAWIVGGFAIFAVERWRRRQGPDHGFDVENLSIHGALMIGFMQALALCPGVSRSLVCMLGGLLVGMRFAAALEFSFLLGGLTLFAASGYKAVKYRQEILHDLTPTVLMVGLASATIAAFLTVRWMIRSLSRFGLAPFGYYRIALGVGVMVWMIRQRA